MVGTHVARNYAYVYKKHTKIFVMEFNKNESHKYFMIMIT
jgi:hypothetical protein